MNLRKARAASGIALAVLAGGGWLMARGHRPAAYAAPAHTERQGVELTVYTQDFAMVHEVRPVQLTAGANRLHVPDVSRQLDPQSILLDWSDNRPGLPQLVSNSYDLGVQNGDALLKRYLGQTVELVRYGNDGQEAGRQQGTLMVQDGGQMVLQSDGKFYIDPRGTIVAPASGDIVTIPQLSVQADSTTAQAANLDVAYLTRGLSWSADYVAVLAPHNNTLDLQCWAAVTNRTGVDYPNAKVSLVAGNPNRAVQPAKERTEMMKQGMEYDREAGGFGGGRRLARAAIAAPEAVGDNYVYPVRSQTTIVQERMNRLLMLESANVSVQKDYSTRPPALSAWYDDYNWGRSAPSGRGHVQIALKFTNADKEGLGQPLPQGAIRIYEPDASGSLRYAGAAPIPDTPHDQKVDITLAQAFDLFTEWHIVKSQQIGKHLLRKQIELTLRSEKQAPVDLRVVQTLDGQWKLATSSNPHTNLDAQNVQWIVNVPAGGKRTLTYTVDFRI
jgi:hypothetical protein